MLGVSEGQQRGKCGRRGVSKGESSRSQSQRAVPGTRSIPLTDCSIEDGLEGTRLKAKVLWTSK